MRKTQRYGMAFTLAAAAPSMLANEDTHSDTATYSVAFVPSWNPASHALEYPITHGKQGLVTPIIGATHANAYRLFEPGTQPTAGLEKLTETGMHSPLDAETKAAIVARTAGALIEFTEGSPGPVHAPVQMTFDIDHRRPQVSLVGMIAPSPDWFYGVSSVELLKDSRWVPSLVVTAYAWDSGGDAGTTYMAEDMDLEPKAKTRRADTDLFVRNGEKNPVGVFIFKRVPSDGA